MKFAIALLALVAAVSAREIMPTKPMISTTTLRALATNGPTQVHLPSVTVTYMPEAHYTIVSGQPTERVIQVDELMTTDHATFTYGYPYLVEDGHVTKYMNLNTELAVKLDTVKANADYKMVVIGGEGGFGNVIGLNEVLDVAEDRWLYLNREDYDLIRTGGGAATIQNGTIYYCAGYPNNFGEYSNRCMYANIHHLVANATNRSPWTLIPTNIPAPVGLAYGGMAAIGHKLYVDGGPGNKMYVYNMKEMQWSVFPHPEPFNVFDTIVEQVDGTLYVMNNQFGSDCVKYTPGVTFNWERCTPERFYGARSVSYMGKIWVAGGFNNNNQLWMYDAKADSWSEKACMRTGRAQPAVGAMGEYIYVCGGQGLHVHGSYGGCEKYHIPTNSWNPGPDMHVGREFGHLFTV